LFNRKISLIDFEASLIAALTNRYRPYTGALVSFAYAPTAADGPELVSCRWAFVDEPEPVRATVTYPVLVLEDRWLPMENAAGELLRVLRGETALGGCMLREFASELEEMDTSRESFTGWRESVFEASLGHGGYSYDRTPVVAKGLRPYPSMSLAVNDWVWRQRHDPSWVISILDLGKLRVLLPDTRARIRKASWVGSTLMLVNDRNAASEDVELQGVIAERRTATMLPSRAVEPEVAWEVPAEADVIEVYLVHRDGTLLSSHRLTRGEHYHARPGDFALRERAEEEVRQGEGERVEYKPFISAENGKEHELIRTVVAFSNTFGGRLYVGVEDDGTPQGEVQLRKIGRANEETALASVVRQIGKLIREKIKPVPDATVTPITVFGSPIVVVDVLPGEDAPYSTFENDVFIRRGATNRKPDPRTELPWVVDRARERRERRQRQEHLDAMDASSYQKGDD
jgi:hypothetical protein